MGWVLGDPNQEGRSSPTRKATAMKRLLAISLLCCLLTPSLADAKAEDAVSKVLDGFHLAASKADGTGYFGYFAPEGVFLGTDGGERWTVEEFRAYAMPHFSQGKGWTYHPSNRHIAFSPDATTAWFDEALSNANYGATRGSGVLRLVGGEWKICQYNLSVPVPNDLLPEVVKMIRAK